MEIKVGELYKIKKGCEHECQDFGNSDGEYIKVTAKDGEYELDYDILDKDQTVVSSCSCFEKSHLESVSGKSVKPKPYKFVVIWKERDGDPSEFFHTLPQARKKATELSEQDQVTTSSIKIVEIKNLWEISPSITIKKIK